MAEQSPDPLREGAPAYDDFEAKRARIGVAAALFGPSEDEPERLSVGRYEIDSRLGAGGMGVVFRAHDPDLDRPVAVKLLHADSSADDKARARMLREARALAKLSHPNVITVYDVGTEDGQVFVAMELVAGPDLRRWLDGRRCAQWRATLELFIAAGRGLAAAHEVALVHRDFKPENVLVGDDGRVRVLDFGLARVHRPVEAPSTDDRERAPAPSLAQTDGGAGADADLAHLPTAAFAGGLTETGALIGTPLYMAPELYLGRPADARSDQFAFCASLYEGVYRQLPFGSRNISAHVQAVSDGRVIEPDPDSPVPRRLWQIIARGLDPDPDARHDDMAAVLVELEAVLAEPVATELPEAGSSWRWFGVAALVVVAVVGLVGLELGLFAGPNREPGSSSPGSEPEPAPASESAQVAAAEPAVSEPGVVEPAASEPGADAGAALELALASDTGEVEPGTDTGAEAEPELAAPAPAPELRGWCHLHEDRYTLLTRTNTRRGSFEHDGVCFTCRVERRRSRTRNFSPRDCAGYSLCGKASADACS
ncbi:Serine/threonine-protein kinase PK-1 [Enhygromyxa salina]|uniref:Serine/threonine-protein kinase PK-1 n=1 Tax=Enhygromyxa salina TaxID=215803 RepID=A0A2S9XAX0_9BACT|nr:serine/threonine-protein kinase [Enhygromyxa salina]PRP89998.1 Serine/threonine-protein kinase PK-1 [Enhygromyxa salina]